MKNRYSPAVDIDEKKQVFTTRQYMVEPDFEFFHYKDEPRLEVEYHNHDFFEIYFLISGKVNYVVEGKNYNLKPNDIIIISDTELHKPLIEEGCIYERMVLWVNPSFIRKKCTEDTDLFMCFESIHRNKYNLLRPGAEMHSIIKNLLVKLNKICSTTGYGNNLLRETYLTELIVYLNRAFLETHDDNIEDDITYDEKINNMLHYINSNLDRELTLESLSARFYTSKYHLLRQFKKITGFTLHGYIRKKRLIYAKTMLKEGKKVIEVCQICGFGDYSNFIRAFRNTYGISPDKYAKMTRA